MFNRTRNITTLIDSDNDDIIFAIVTNNLTKIKNLILRSNVNKVIDKTNGYTAIHYAVTLPHNSITQYLLEMGADPTIKQNEGYDAYELSLRSGKKYIFDYQNTKKDTTIKELETDNNKLILKIEDIKRTNEYLINSSDNYNNKITNLNKEIINLSKENTKLKRELEESETAFSNLLKKQKK